MLSALSPTPHSTTADGLYASLNATGASRSGPALADASITLTGRSGAPITTPWIATGPAGAAQQHSGAALSSETLIQALKSPGSAVVVAYAPNETREMALEQSLEAFPNDVQMRPLQAAVGQPIAKLSMENLLDRTQPRGTVDLLFIDARSAFEAARTRDVAQGRQKDGAGVVFVGSAAAQATLKQTLQALPAQHEMGSTGRSPSPLPGAQPTGRPVSPAVAVRGIRELAAAVGVQAAMVQQARLKPGASAPLAGTTGSPTPRTEGSPVSPLRQHWPDRPLPELPPEAVSSRSASPTTTVSMNDYHVEQSPHDDGDLKVFDNELYPSARSATAAAASSSSTYAPDDGSGASSEAADPLYTQIDAASGYSQVNRASRFPSAGMDGLYTRVDGDAYTELEPPTTDVDRSSASSTSSAQSHFYEPVERPTSQAIALDRKTVDEWNNQATEKGIFLNELGKKTVEGLTRALGHPGLLANKPDSETTVEQVFDQLRAAARHPPCRRAIGLLHSEFASRDATSDKLPTPAEQLVNSQLRHHANGLAKGVKARWNACVTGSKFHAALRREVDRIAAATGRTADEIETDRALTTLLYAVQNANPLMTAQR